MALDPRQILEMFEAAGGVLRGHYSLSSGHHSAQYVQGNQVLGRPEVTERIAAEVANRFRNEDVTCVVGAAPGGAFLAYAAARRLGARALYAERLQSIMGFARGFALDERDRVLILEDAAITGQSVREVMELVELAGAQTIGVAVVIDRSPGGLEFGVRTECLATYGTDVYLPDECPLCLQHIPLRRPKHGRL